MIFIYKAKSHSGELIQSSVQAANEHQAIKILSERDLFILDIHPEAQQNKLLPSKKVSLKDKIIFTKELAMMTKGGLPLVDALESLAEQTENENFSQAISAIATDIKGGTSLSQALSKYPKIFPDLYISITASGEQSGKLDEVLLQLAEQLQKDYDLISRVKSATTYPIVVVSALVGIMIVMLVFVIPKLKSIFAEMGVALPLITRLLLGLSDGLVKYWYAVLALALIIFLAVRSWALTPAGRITVDKWKIKFPLFGALARQIYLARFSRTMATLIASGLPMLGAIETVQKVVGNKVYVSALETVKKDIENGIALSSAIKKQNKYNLFPPMISQMIAMGEKSGNVDFVLKDMADFYDKEVEAATSNMASLIEPILILIIGAFVGIAIAAVLMPMYSLVNAI